MPLLSWYLSKVLYDKGMLLHYITTHFLSVYLHKFLVYPLNSSCYYFSQGLFEETISDEFPLVTEVLTVSATDPDGDDLFYELVEEEEEHTVALEYFFMEEESGKLKLKKPLTEGAQERFTVSYCMVWRVIALSDEQIKTQVLFPNS